MTAKPRATLKLKGPRPLQGKDSTQVIVSADPQAYVMPDLPEPSASELAQMSAREYQSYVYRKMDIYPPEKYPLPGSEWDIDEFEAGGAYDDDYDDDTGPIDDRTAELYLRDWRRNVAHDPSEDHGVEIEGDRDAMLQLIIAVTTSLNRLRRPPKAEAIAAGIGLAISMVRRVRGVKHPRDIAKDVGVRAQTLHQIKNLALSEIQRLSLTSILSGGSDEKPGTYNQLEEDEVNGDDH
ncbi:MAG TPA: hypothetical protein VN844_19485 [Pyrinomonadaceae bacterium]|nr:hypothetical protein [Pyrinomonadaceae bacterium]